MKNKTKIIILFTYLLTIIILVVRLFIISSHEVVDTKDFIDYYEKGDSENGGLELTTDNFITFTKEYNFVKEIKTEDTEKNEKQKIEKKKEKKVIKKMEMLTYKIVSGDNLSKISKKLNVSTDTLKIYNSSARKGRFIVNKELTYPSKDGVLYKIKRGDSIPKIAKLYQIKEEDIISNNKINPKKLVAGKKIFLPKVSYKRFNELKNNKTSKVSKTKKTKNNKKNKSNKKIQVSGKSSYGFSFPIKYRGINSRFGYRLHPVLRRYILHTGVDLVAKYVPLRAAKDGVVSYAGWMRGYGKIIIIKHSNNYETRYAHLSVISTRAGERVRRGEFIGKTGKSGRVTGPHLHLEVRYKGVPKNPMKYF